MTGLDCIILVQLAFKYHTANVVTIAIDTVVFSSYAFLAYRGVQSFRKSWLAKPLQRIVGAALVGFGVRLLCSRK